MSANHLARETSPYLRQHAENPVDWHPWTDEAFRLASERDVPVFLSIGYSACHWCHVMAHESFEDLDVASLLNSSFVSVKVDREERPDVDSVYMSAVQALTGSGGWPMSVFLLPDRRPFFAGTYLPKPAFVDLLGRIVQAWNGRRGDLEADAARVTSALTSAGGMPRVDPSRSGGGSVGATLEEAARSLVSHFDEEWGGFGSAPKFPQVTGLEMLLQDWFRTKRAEVLGALTTTLDAMASGGIYDHLAGGFCRYSTDRRWLVPHFEKMLYDNAQLARLYLHAWQATGRDRFLQVATETLGYMVDSRVHLSGGGFASAEDADSEGVEGKYYTWALDEILEVANGGTAEWYGARPAGNWEGVNILWRPDRGVLERPAEVEQGRLALLARRSCRTPPGLDDKVLTEWNAMAVAALAEAGAATGATGWIEAAAACAEFLCNELRDDDGRWLRSWQGGRAPHLALAADYAWLVEAFTQLSAATGRARWIKEARLAADRLIELFWDRRERGFRTTGADAEKLIAIPMDTYDGAVPSANSVAAGALLRLGALTGERRYVEVVSELLSTTDGALHAAPAAFPGMAMASDLADAGIVEVVVPGDSQDMVAEAQRIYRPDMVLAWGEPFDSPLWVSRTGPDVVGKAFVCRDYVCLAPARNVSELSERLSS